MTDQPELEIMIYACITLDKDERAIYEKMLESMRMIGWEMYLRQDCRSTERSMYWYFQKTSKSIIVSDFIILSIWKAEMSNKKRFL